MGRRTLLLIAAFLIAALGTAGVYLYVNGVDQRAKADNSVVQVLVATAPIAAGTTAGQAERDRHLALRDYLRSSVEGFEFRRDTVGITDQVALAPIAAGQPILTTQFGAAGQKVDPLIPTGKLALSLNMTAAQRVAAFLDPGDKVTVFVTTGDGRTSGSVTRVLLPSVQVLGIGRRTALPTSDPSAPAQADDGVDSSLLTLAVDQTEAQKLVFAQLNGKLAFGLIGDTRSDPTNAGVDAGSLFQP